MNIDLILHLSVWIERWERGGGRNWYLQFVSGSMLAVSLTSWALRGGVSRLCIQKGMCRWVEHCPTKLQYTRPYRAGVFFQPCLSRAYLGW